jgi:hypothetical protein
VDEFQPDTDSEADVALTPGAKSTGRDAEHAGVIE